MRSILDILCGILPHHFPELGQRFGGVLLVVDGDGGVVTEIDSADGQQMLYVILFDQGGEIVLNCLVPATAQGPAIQLATGLAYLEEDLFNFRTDRDGVLDEAVLVDGDDSADSLVLELESADGRVQSYGCPL